MTKNTTAGIIIDIIYDNVSVVIPVLFGALAVFKGQPILAPIGFLVGMFMLQVNKYYERKNTREETVEYMRK